MKTKKHLYERPNYPFTGIEDTAHYISSRMDGIWYVMQCKGKGDVVVPEPELAHNMRIGYKVACAFERGKRFANIIRTKDGLQYVTYGATTT